MVPLMQAGRIRPSVVAAATLVFLLAATAADACGGRSSSRMRGFVSAPNLPSPVSSTSPGSSTSPSSSTSPAAISAPAKAVQPTAAPTKKAPTANLIPVGTIATAPAPPAAAPAHQIGARVSQLGAIVPLSTELSKDKAGDTAIPTAQVVRPNPVASPQCDALRSLPVPCRLRA